MPLDTETLDLTTDEALLSSLEEHKLDELKLEPYSLLRQAVATDLCDRGGGTFYNAVMTIWVCTLNPSEALRAHANMEEAKIKAFEWGESRGYSLWTCKPLLDAYIRLQNEYYAASQAKLKESGNGEGPVPNVGGQPT